MGERVTLELPEQVVRSAREVARKTHREFEDVLVEWIDRALADVPVELLEDEQVLALADMQLDPATNDALSELLYQHQAGAITEAQRHDLQDLMLTYRRGWVRKAQALQVAVERGLRAPLSRQ